MIHPVFYPMTALTQEHLHVVIDDSLARVRCLAEASHGRFPTVGQGSSYLLKDNSSWLAGFWPGLLWLGYGTTGDSFFAEAAANLLPTFAERLERRVHITHDLGFLFTLSARAQWQMTGDKAARELALRAADMLVARYRQPGRYIQAWGAIGDPQEGGRIIADTMMNLPLLFWASAESGDERYQEAAVEHTRRSITYLIRPDGSSHHTFFFHQDSGQPDRAETHQGYSDESWWSRGHAWLLYGIALSAEWSGDESFLTAARRLAATFCSALPQSYVPLWDFRLPPAAPAYFDSSAGAIAACGLQRLAAIDRNPLFRRQAEQIVEGLLMTCLEEDAQGQGLLKHGALHVPKDWAPDAYLIFGDYFFLEAMLTLTGQAPDFWGPEGE